MWLGLIVKMKTYNNNIIVGVTGHRKLGDSYKVPNPTYDYVKKEYINHIKQLQEFKPITHIITGMAIGYDVLVANVAIELGIPFIAAVPFKGQESKWLAQTQKEYQKLLSEACAVVFCSEGFYSPQKMQIRNEYIVNNSDIMIACFNGVKNGGTWNCISYAKSVGKKVYIIDPNGEKE